MIKLTAHLSGTENSLPDFPVPLTSLGISKRDAAVSYYTISTPFSDALLQAFTDRPDGKLYLQRNGQAWESFNVGHPIRYDIGPTSATIQISGTRQETNASPTTHTPDLSMVSNWGINSSGELTLDLIYGAIDPRPGDTVTWQGTDYLITLTKFSARSNGQTLSINAQEITP